MEDGGHDTSAAALSMTNNANPNSNPTHNDGEPALTPTSPTAGPARTRSGSTSSNTHRRSMSGSLLSKFSFLRTNTTSEQAGASGTAITERDDDDDDGDNDVPGSGFRGGSKAMASALQQQQRRTRRRRGSLRKTALLGTRFESKKLNRVNSISGENNNNNNNNAVELLRGGEDIGQQHTAKNTMRPFSNSVSTGIGEESRAKAAFDRENNPRWGYINAQQKKPLRGASASVSSRRESGLVRNNNVRGEEIGTDDEDVISYRRPDNNNNDDDENNDNQGGPAIAATGLQHKHLGTPSSSSDSYYALQADPSTYGTTVHRPPKSSLAAHHTTDIKPTTHAHQQEKIIWDYSETEWWGWIILLVTWLVFVVGMGSCFGVWSWAWDVGETPYAPPELEDDPTLPIVGYYPALIILTAVMSWVWVVVAWVGMKYFKHANISGEDI